MSAVLAAFIAYLGIVMLIGMLTAFKTRDQSDYLLGGQRIPAWVITISERASGESAWLLLGLTGAALTVGLSEVWTVVGCVSGIIALWLLVGGRVRALMDNTDALTFPELLAQHARRGGQGSDDIRGRAAVRAVASLIVIFFFTFYVAAQMAGAGKVFVQTGIIDPQASWLGFEAKAVGVIIGAAVVVFYTLLGGFSAVVWTDLLQGLVMLFALVVLPSVALFSLPSSRTLGEALASAGAKQGSWFGHQRGFAALIGVLNGLSWGLGYFGQPHLLVRFMAMPSVQGVKRNRLLASGWTLLAYGGAFSVGLLALIGAETIKLTDAETVMPSMAIALLPPWLGGIVIAGAVAAMMSTADSQLLVVTSAFSEDVGRRLLGLELSSRAQVWLSRAVVLTIGLAACWLAVTSGELVYDLVSFSWSGLGAAFGPLVLLLVFRGRASSVTMVATMLSGSLSTVIWKKTPALARLCSERLAAWLLAGLVALFGGFRD